MISPILPIGPAVLPESVSHAGSAAPAGQFQSLLRDAIEHVEQSRAVAQASTERFVNGESQDVHSLMLDIQRAELNFELFVQVRNKVTQAYQEIMRMQL